MERMNHEKKVDKKHSYGGEKNTKMDASRLFCQRRDIANELS
jgi:hypothetical protein